MLSQISGLPLGAGVPRVDICSTGWTKRHKGRSPNPSAVTIGKPWRQGLPECYVERLDALKTYHDDPRDMRADLANIREELSSPEAQRLIDERPSLSALSKDITAVIVLLECAEAKLFNLLPMEETMSPEDLAP